MRSTKLSKRYCKQFLGTVAALFAVLLLYGFIFDPWQLFHQSWFREPVFVNNARFQNAGIINSYDFDSVIIGNSMAENFSAQEASERLGGTFVNLSIAGSFFSERSIFLKHLFYKKKVKNLIISLDHLPYVKVGQFTKNRPPENYEFLYNTNPFDDFKIYFDVNLLKCWDLNESCRKEVPGDRKKSLEELYPWYPHYIKAFGGTQAWCGWTAKSPLFTSFLKEIINVSQAIERGQSIPGEKKFLSDCKANARATFDSYILPFIKEHPETKFYLFTPPYSRLWYAMQEQYYTGYYLTYLSFIEHIVEVTASYPNVSVFGFDDIDATGDIANYKDQSHYHKDVNSELLRLMAERTHIVSNDTLENYTKKIKQLAHDYNLTGIADEFQKCLNQ